MNILLSDGRDLREKRRGEEREGEEEEEEEGEEEGEVVGRALAVFREKGGSKHTHLLGTILETLGEGGVRGRAGLGGGTELDPVVGELALEDAHVAVSFGAVVRYGHREALAGPLCLDGRVVWHGGDGNCDSCV